MKPSWYVRRLASMSPGEVVQRSKDAAAKRAWASSPPSPPAERVDAADSLVRLSPGVLAATPAPAVTATVAAADELLAGSWPFFDRVRHDLAPDPDWFLCVATGRRAPSTGFFATVPHRDEAQVGNIKFVWELSRHQHLTVLAAAYALTGDDRYAERVDLQLRSWMDQNAFLQGVHWTSAIEVGVRLISWVWLRRLLDGWEGATALFDENPSFVEQLWGHQAYLMRFESHGTSANNHLLAEVAGLFAATCAFDWFDESAAWRDHAAGVLRREVALQTFPSGLNRELASEYHGFVLELVLAALVEGEASGHSLGAKVWEPTTAMFDALAATVDTAGHPPRQGDADEGHGLLLAQPHYARWQSLLSTGAELVGPEPWWPDHASDDLRSHLWSAMLADVSLPLGHAHRPSVRPNQFRDAGVTILRDPVATPGHPRADELWCRIDHGPHGFLSTAGHAHADALSIELRHGGVDVLADPGTYCYHGEPEWREYFRSTVGHNTLELLGRDQSKAEGPFLWSTHAAGIVDRTGGLDDGPVAFCAARHNGYGDEGLFHHRLVELRREDRELVVIDTVEGARSTTCRLAFHLGPEVSAELTDDIAQLSWSLGDLTQRATLHLEASLAWKLHRGEEDPILGWDSRIFGGKTPTVALVGTGSVSDGTSLTTLLKLDTQREGSS